MRSKYASVLILVVILIAITIIFFVYPGEIGKIGIIIYGLTVCTYLCAMLSYYMVFQKVQSSVFLQTPLVLTISFMLLIQTVFLLSVRFYDDFPKWIYTVGETIIIAVFLAIVISLVTSQAYIAKNQKTITDKTSFIKHLELDLSILASSISDPETKMLVNNLLSVVKYSDPVSCSETQQVEVEISQWLQVIKDSQSTEIPTIVEKMKQLLDKRNKICITFKK